MIGPSMEPAAITAPPKAGSYPSSFIIGIKKDPKDTISATASPTIAPVSYTHLILSLPVSIPYNSLYKMSISQLSHLSQRPLLPLAKRQQRQDPSLF